MGSQGYWRSDTHKNEGVLHWLCVWLRGAKGRLRTGSLPCYYQEPVSVLSVNWIPPGGTQLTSDRLRVPFHKGAQWNSYHWIEQWQYNRQVHTDWLCYQPTESFGADWRSVGVFGCLGNVNTHKHIVPQRLNISAPKHRWYHQPTPAWNPCVRKSHGCGDICHHIKCSWRSISVVERHCHRNFNGWWEEDDWSYFGRCDAITECHKNPASFAYVVVLVSLV